MKKNISIILVGLFLLAGCGTKTADNATTSANATTSSVQTTSNSTTSNTISEEPNTKADIEKGRVANFRDFDIKIKEIKKAKDFEDKDCIVVTYDFTNKKDAEISAADIMNIEAYQGGRKLDQGFVTESANVRNSMLPIKNGETMEDVAKVFMPLSDSDVELNIVPIGDKAEKTRAKITVPMPK